MIKYVQYEIGLKTKNDLQEDNIKTRVLKMPINIQNNQENFYEKIRKILNNTAAKFSIISAGGLTGIVSLGLITKLIYDKINNKIKLNINDEKYIKKNFFLCKWKNNSCWNDVFIQLLMCPDIRCGNYKSEKIMKTINWINDNLSTKYDGDFLKRKIEVPSDIRPIPDGFENCLHDGKRLDINQEMLWRKFNSKNFEDLKVLNYTLVVRDPINNELFNDGFFISSDEPYMLNYLGDPNNREKNYIANIEIDKSKKILWNLSECFKLSTKNYYPTYIIVYDDIHYTNPTHVFAYYVIYDKNMKIKYFLKVDDLEQNMEIVPKDKALKDLNVYHHFWFVFSRGDIVKKYYVPR